MSRSFAGASLALALALALAGCEGDGACESCAAGGDGSGGGDGGEAAAGGGSTTSGWVPLITGSWELAEFDEITSDLHFVTLDRDIYVGAIRPISPPGTHHTVLALGSLGTSFLYASGVGTNELSFPAGVGLKLHAGDTLVLQLHVFNPAGEPLAGTSGIEVIEVSEADVQEVAELFLPGPTDLQIGPNQMTTQSGTCTVQAPTHVFALFPHMHQLGKRLKTTLTIAGEQTVLYDEPYEFAHQPFVGFEPIAMAAGDTVTTECTWENTTAELVGWGESSNAEMCFSIMYRYPATGSSSVGGFCTE